MSSEPSLAELAVRLVGSLAVVVGILLLIARTVNRRFKAPSGAAIQVVHRQALGRGQGVAVISVGTRVLVVGTTEHQVTLLTEVEPDEVGLDLTAEEDEDAEVGEPTTVPRLLRSTRPAVEATGALAGSILSLQTWKQTLAAFTQRQQAPAATEPDGEVAEVAEVADAADWPAYDATGPQGASGEAEPPEKQAS